MKRSPILWLCIVTWPVAAQDVGLGARRGTGERFEAPYTLEIETPHVKWFKPLPGGPIRLLAVPSVSEGRTLVELAQRLSLELTTVSIDPAWDVNKWTMAFGPNYGARAERGDLKLIYSYLETALTGDKRFDAILLPLNHGWERLTPASREALARRVREGAGLVLIRPFENDLAPLAPVTAPPKGADESEPIEPGPAHKGAWKTTSPHYVTRGIPLEYFPFQHIEHYVCRAAPGATVLVESADGHPILAVKEYGKGRVVAFGYRNDGLSWRMPVSARFDSVDAYWEYFYALLCRALVWAARREPRPNASASPPAVWRLRAEDGKILETGVGRPSARRKLVAGRYFLEQQAGPEWRISVIEIPAPDRVENLTISPAVISEGDTVTVQWQSQNPGVAELVDGFGRVLARAQGASPLSLRAGRPLTHSGYVEVRAGGARARREVRYAASSREWTDYEVLLPWAGPRGYQPWTGALDEQFRRIGVTVMARPERNFKLMVSAHLPGFGIYWYRRDSYLKRKEAFIATGDKKYLTRDVILQTPELERGLRAQLEKSYRPLVPLRPFAVYLADESSLTCYADAFDVDWSPPALAGFRAWLRQQYGALEALNAAWNTNYRNWEDVVPMTTEEAQKHGNYAPWADHRAYMEAEFVRAFELARSLVHAMDPGGRASVSGTQIPTPHNGCNWYEIDRQIDYLQPYSGGNQDAMHHLFRSGMPITGFTGYGLTGEEAQYQQWQRLFYGHTGASIFWHYTLLNPDLTLSAQGKALAEVFSRLQAGIGRIFINSRVREDGVAIHFSMASIRGAWITDGRITAGMGYAQRTSKNFAELMARRDRWVQELERQGVQFRFLATPQIEQGALEDYRILILPYSIAISDKEAEEIEKFMDRGGIVYADEQTGRMDERCRWRKTPLWQQSRKGLIRAGPGALGIRRALDVPGEFLTTVREFGDARLIGLLPKEKTKIALPRLEGIVYDLLRGGLAAPALEAGPAEPVLLLIRPTRIHRLALNPDLSLSLEDDNGRPIALSVVRIQLFDPTGKLVRHYSQNVTIRNGRAAFSIPWALNDPAGAWRIRATDVVSGLVAERIVRRPGRIPDA